MNDRKILKIAATAGACALVLGLTFFESKRREYLHIKDPSVVFTAASDIGVDHVLTEADVVAKKIPREFIEAGAVTKKEEALGSVLLTDVLKGEQITRAKAAPPGLSGGLAAFVPLSMRAVSVELQNDAAVAGLVKPGDTVDVVSVFELTSSGVTRQSAHAVSTGVKVLAVGANVTSRQRVLSNLPSGERGIFANDERDRKTFVVTLAASPQEALKIALAKETGAVSLLLRPPVKEIEEDRFIDSEISRAATLSDIAGGEAAFGTARRFREYRGR